MSQEHSFKLTEARKAIILSRNATQGWILPGVVTKTETQRTVPKGRGRFHGTHKYSHLRKPRRAAPWSWTLKFQG